MEIIGNLFIGFSLLLAGSLCLTIPSGQSRLGRRIGRFVLRLMPYRGWIGVSICIWGLWGTLSSLRIIPILWLAPVGLWWVTNLAGSLLNVGVGLVVGFDFIQARLLSKVSISKEIMEKIEKFFMHLAGRKVYLGYISVAAAAWILIINIVTVLQWRGP
ncbi:MAG TPA: hypothetical protein VMX75_10765 [Spirochaetia bacterium]|nr:hypothetical protein [Spirochaetia bacterium]